MRTIKFAIYSFLGQLTHNGENPYRASVERLADFFDFNYEATRRAFEELVEQGWLTVRGDGYYYYVTHEKRKANPKFANEKCAVRNTLPWQEFGPDDASHEFVAAVYGILGKIRLMPGHVAGIRKLAPDNEILCELKKEAETAKSKLKPGSRWSRNVAHKAFWTVYNRLKARGTNVPTNAPEIESELVKDLG